MYMGHQIKPLANLEDQKNCSVENSRKNSEEDEVTFWSPVSGISTGSCGSSSSFSLTDDTETSTARELEEQFQQFEEALYLETSPTGLPQSLQDEVKIWTEYTPHIRIRGIQAKLNERFDNNEEIEDNYSTEYEEVIAFHEANKLSHRNHLFSDDIIDGRVSPTTPEAISYDLKNSIVSEFFDKAWPNVLEKVRPVVKSISAGKGKTHNINDSVNVQANLEITKSQKILSRSNSSRSYLRDISPRKPNVDKTSEYSCIISSMGVRQYDHNDCFSNGLLSEREPYRAPRTSLPKTKANRISTYSARYPKESYINRTKLAPLINKKEIKSFATDKTVILPPIEALAITPKKPDKRVNSAMVRFTKTLPRVRPNTSRKKSGGVKTLKKVQGKRTDGTLEESVHNIREKQLSSIKNRRTARSIGDNFKVNTKKYELRDRLELDIGVLSKKNEMFSSLLDSKKNKIEEVFNKLKKTQSEISRLTLNKAELEKNIKDLHTTLNSQSNEISKKNNKIEVLQNDYKNTIQQLSEERAKNKYILIMKRNKEEQESKLKLHISEAIYKDHINQLKCTHEKKVIPLKSAMLLREQGMCGRLQSELKDVSGKLATAQEKNWTFLSNVPAKSTCRQLQLLSPISKAHSIEVLSGRSTGIYKFARDISPNWRSSDIMRRLPEGTPKTKPSSAVPRINVEGRVTKNLDRTQRSLSKQSQNKVKLLVRSHAVREETSPPPDLPQDHITSKQESCKKDGQPSLSHGEL